MRRAILTLGTTAAGLAALLSFKTHTSVADVADPAAAPTPSTATGAPTPRPGTSRGRRRPPPTSGS